jgi:sugar phosphate isomerase/epimerase
MKLCISTLACPGWDLQQIIDVCAANQIAGVDFRGLQNEIDVTKLPAFTGDGLDESLSRLRSRGNRDPLHEQRRCLGGAGRAVERHARRNSPHLRHLPAQRHALLARLRRRGAERDDPGEGRILAQRRLRQLAKMTRPAKVLILIETHDHWITFEQVNELLADTDPEEVGVLWDTEHTWRKGEPPETTVARHGERLRHVHVKDSTPPPAGEKKSVPKLLGEGELPIGQFVKALTDAGYEGWYCLETEKRWHQAAPEPEVSIPQFAQYMRGLST